MILLKNTTILGTEEQKIQSHNIENLGTIWDSDDTKEVVEKRLKVYHEQTAPLIDYYKKKKALHTIDSTVSKDAVLLEILKIAGQNK